MISEEARYPKFYPNIHQLVYAPRWYYPQAVKKDEYSHKIFYYSKMRDNSTYFWKEFKVFIDKLKNNDLLNEIDLITIIPSSKIGKFSPTLEVLVVKVSEYLDVPFEKIIFRVKEETKKSEIKNLSAEKRYLLTKDSMEIKGEVNNKKVLLIDDTKTTGMTILEAKKILLKKGVKEIVAVCLGINSNFDRGEKENGN